MKVSRPQGTYMLFLDCTEWCQAHGKTIDELEQAGWDVGVAWQDGIISKECPSSVLCDSIPFFSKNNAEVHLNFF